MAKDWLESGKEMGKKSYDYAAGLNRHTWMIVVSIILLFVGLIGFISLCGAQTGSSETAGCGSLVASSTGDDGEGDIDPTTEVVAEFLIVLFFVLGIGLLTYAWTITSVSKKLINEGFTSAALNINKNGNVSSDELDEAKKDEFNNLANELGFSAKNVKKSVEEKYNSGKKYLNDRREKQEDEEYEKLSEKRRMKMERKKKMEMEDEGKERQRMREMREDSEDES